MDMEIGILRKTLSDPEDSKSWFHLSNNTGNPKQLQNFAYPNKAMMNSNSGLIKQSGRPITQSRMEDEFGTSQAQGFGKTGFNNTQGSLGTNPASLKGKLMSLEEMIKSVSDEMNYHKKEVQILKSEKDTLESVLSMKTQEVKKSLTNELMRIEEEMKRHFAHQKAENSRLQQQITALKGEKTALQQQLLGLQRRISELEMQVGNEEQMQ